MDQVNFHQMHRFSKRGDLWEKIEDGSLGLPTLEPLGEGGPDLYYFFLGDEAFAMDDETLLF